MERYSIDLQIRMGAVEFRIMNIIYGTIETAIYEHSHGPGCYEIHYIPEGSGILKVGDSRYEITPNTVFMTGPGVVHEQIPMQQSIMREFCLNLLVIDHRKTRTEIEDDFMSTFLNTTFWFGQDGQNLSGILSQIREELRAQRTGYMIQTEALIRECIVSMVRSYQKEVKSEVHFEQSHLTDSRYYILENCLFFESETITLYALSARLGLSTRQTERFIRQCYGKTFTQKKKEVRMIRAKELLKSGSLKISEIAEQLGYSTTEHFSRSFQAAAGVTPAEYRKRMQ